MAYWKNPRKGEYPEFDRSVIVVYFNKPLFDIGVRLTSMPDKYWIDNVRVWAYLPKIWKN